MSALVASLLLAQALVGGPASAFPAGAYWYKSLDLQHAWTHTRGAGVTVAVIDTGVKASIADLHGQVLPGLDLSGHDPSAHNDSRAKGEGNYGHGTAMAALIAGTGRRGLTGVAPMAKILPIDVDDGDTVSVDKADQAIRWAVDHHADVINLSLGSDDPCRPSDAAAVKYAYDHGVLVVAASGNEGGPVSTPANCPGALAVGAIDSSFRPWSGSNSGSELDFVAPGVNMIDELLDGTAAKPGDATSNGTSSAAAIVAGTFALLRAKFPHDTPRQLVTRALYNVHNGLGKGHQGERIGDKLGYGVILPAFALTEAPPAHASNPIYDRFASELAPSGSSTSSAPSRSGSSESETAPDGVVHVDSSGAVASDSSGPTGFPIWIVLLAIIVVGGVAAVFLTRRSRRNRPRFGGPPPS